MKKIVLLLVTLSLTLYAKPTTYTYNPRVEKEIKRLLVKNEVIKEASPLEIYATFCTVAEIVDGGTLPGTIEKKSDIAEYIANLHADVKFGASNTLVKAEDIKSGKAPALIYEPSSGNIWYYNLMSERTKATLYVYMIHSPELILGINEDGFQERSLDILQKFHNLYLNNEFKKAVFQEEKGRKLVVVSGKRRVK
jgi:hypothetical protein